MLLKSFKKIKAIAKKMFNSQKQTSSQLAKRVQIEISRQRALDYNAAKKELMRISKILLNEPLDPKTAESLKQKLKEHRLHIKALKKRFDTAIFTIGSPLNDLKDIDEVKKNIVKDFLDLHDCSYDEYSENAI